MSMQRILGSFVFSMLCCLSVGHFLWRQHDLLSPYCPRPTHDAERQCVSRWKLGSRWRKLEKGPRRSRGLPKDNVDLESAQVNRLCLFSGSPWSRQCGWCMIRDQSGRRGLSSGGRVCFQANEGRGGAVVSGATSTRPPYLLRFKADGRLRLVGTTAQHAPCSSSLPLCERRDVYFLRGLVMV